MPKNQELDDAMEKAASLLSGLCDSVVILCTEHGRSGPDITETYQSTRGNGFASYAAMKEKVLIWEENVRVYTRREDQKARGEGRDDDDTPQGEDYYSGQ